MLAEKMNKGFSELGNKIDKVGENVSGLRSETQANFDRMDEKYGKIE